MALYETCRLFAALPYGGGVLDQDARLMQLMQTCHSAAVLSKSFDIRKPAHRDFYRWLFPKDG